MDVAHSRSRTLSRRFLRRETFVGLPNGQVQLQAICFQGLKSLHSLNSPRENFKIWSHSSAATTVRQRRDQFAFDARDYHGHQRKRTGSERSPSPAAKN